MMQETSEIPEWAWRRSHELAYGDMDRFDTRQSPSYRMSRNARALAAYIAEHEEPPVDPLDAEAERLYREWLDGDEGAKPFLLKALRRGIELGASS